MVEVRLKSTKMQRILRSKESGRGRYNNKIAVTRLRSRTYDAHDKRPIEISRKRNTGKQMYRKDGKEKIEKLSVRNKGIHNTQCITILSNKVIQNTECIIIFSNKRIHNTECIFFSATKE